MSDSLGLEVLKGITCCLSNDGHIVYEPVKVKCGANACKNCKIDDSYENNFKCSNCNERHDRIDLQNEEINIEVESIIKSSLRVLFQDLEKKLNPVIDALNDDNAIIELLKTRTENIEYEIDVRVESLVTEIYKYSDEFKFQLNQSKNDLEKWINEKKLQKPNIVKEDVLSSDTLSCKNFNELQKKLKLYQSELDEYRSRIYGLHFIPCSESVSRDLFGMFVDDRSWFKTSSILTEEEGLALALMTETSDGELLYKASKDGFDVDTFHRKCDGKGNTVTIIKNNFDFVFGGYCAEEWTSEFKWVMDPKAYIFSLRRNSVSKTFKFLVTNPSCAIHGGSVFGPAFGGAHDIEIIDKSNINVGSYTNLGDSYEAPFDDSDRNRYFLAGSFNEWLTVEIEVYQLYK